MSFMGKRIVRGNTYAAQILPPSQQAELERLEEERERKKMVREQMRKSRHMETMETVPQPAEYAIDDYDPGYQPLDEDDIPEGYYNPRKRAAEVEALEATNAVPVVTSAECETQIDEGDLFCFDAEVEPILEVLAGKSIDLAVIELAEEIDREKFARARLLFEQEKNCEMSELHRQVAESQRKNAERLNREEQEKKHIEEVSQISKTVEARKVARKYLDEVELAVFDALDDAGEFKDPVEEKVKDAFLPTVVSEVANDLLLHKNADKLRDDILRATILKMEG